MDKTLNRRRGQSLGAYSILKSIIKIEGFQLTGKSHKMYMHECLQEVSSIQ